MTAKPRSRWWRRLWRLTLLVVAARVLLALLLAPLLSFAAGFAGLTVTMRSASLSLSGMALRLEDVMVLDADRPLEPPLLVAQEIGLDVSSLLLLRGELGIVDAAVSGARISLTRRSDGSLRLPASWSPSPTAAPPVATPPPVAESAPTPPTFALPLRIASARLHDCRLHLADEAAPGAPIDITLDVDVDDVGRFDRPGTIVVRAQSPRWLDRFTLQAEVLATPDRLHATWEGHVRGVPPASLPLPREFAAALQDTRLLALTMGGELDGEIPPGASHRLLAGAVHLDVEGDHNDPLHLALRLGPPTDRGADAGIPFELEFAALGLVKQLRLHDGELRLHAASTMVRASLAAEEAKLPWLRPLLAAQGVTMPEAGVSVHAQAEVEFGDGITGSLRGLQIAGGELELALPRLDVRGLRAADGGLAIDSVVVRGPHVAVHTEADGVLVFAGIRLGKRPPGPGDGAAADAPAAVVPPAASAGLPHLRIGSLDWTEGSVAWTDGSLTPPATLRVEELSVRGDALTLGASAPPARLQISARLDGAIAELQLDATLESSPTALRGGVGLTARGVTGGSALPWLQRLGITPALQAGALQLRADAAIEFAPEGTRLQARLHDLALRDGDELLLSLDSVQGTAMHFGEAPDLGSWEVERPFLQVRRLADGSLRALGLHFPSGATPAAAAAPAARPAPAPGGAAPAAPLRLGPLSLRDGRVQFDDGAGPPLELGLQATVGRIDADAPFPFTLTAALPGPLAAARLAGQAALGPAPRAELQLVAEGLHGAAMQRLLPPPLRCELADGRLQLGAKLAQQAGPAGEQSLELTGLQLTDGDAEWFAIDRCAIQLAAATADHVHVRDLAVQGVRATVQLGADGMRAGGFVLPPAGAAPATAPGAAPAAPHGAPGVRVPRLSVDALAIACERVVLRDTRQVGGEPLVFTGTLAMDPWAAGPDVETPPPARLRLLGSAQPLCAELRADLTLDPFALAPTAEVQVRAVVDPTAVPRVLPPLAATLQGTTDRATLTATMHARLDLRRRDARRFDFSRPFGGELACEAIELRDEVAQQPIASVRSLAVNARAIDVRSGDVLLRSLELDDPIVSATRTPEGVELLGFRLLPAKDAPPVPPAAAPPAGGGEPSEFTVDRLEVGGLNLTLRDQTTTPPTLLPIAGCDVELTRFSTRGFREVLPFGFSVSLRGGNVPFARRILRSSMFAGILGSAAAAAGLGAGELDREERPLLDELQLVGHLQAYPRWKGQVRAELTAFELPALRGLAKSGGVEINDGVFDHSLTVDLRGFDGIDVRSTTVFTWLSLSEPPGGPISTYLRLPAPLDTVLFLLRNDADEHRLQLQLHIPAEGPFAAAIQDVIAEAVLRILAGAVGGAAGRATGMLTGALGLTGGPTANIQVPVAFAPGSSAPAALDLRTVRDALAGDAQLEVVLLHELSAADLQRAEHLATPPPEEIAEHGKRLRLRRDQLLADRPQLAATVAALYGAGRMQEARLRQAELVAHDEVLGDVERTLYEVLGMLADDTPRAQKRRTEAAAKALGTARLAEVQAALASALPGLAKDRVVLRPARAVPTAELAAGGQVVVTVRRSSAR